MDDGPDTVVAASEAALMRWGRAAAVVVLVVAAVYAAVAAIGIQRLVPSWPQAQPWTGLWLAALAAATLVQSGHPSRGRVWVGRAVAAAVGVLAAGVLARYLATGAFGLVEAFGQSALAARPGPRTTSSILYLSAAIALIRIDGRRTNVLQRILLVAALATPLITIVGHMFRAVSAVSFAESTGQTVWTAVGVVMLVGATLLARPDRNPVAWLLARPDRWALLRLVSVVCGLPVLISLSRQPFLALGLGTEAAWVLATTIATVMIGVAAFYFSQREQGLLIERELLSRQRADAEMRYHLLADNAVDVIFHLHGSRVTWVSPSVEAAFGEPAQHWTGADLSRRIHPDDLDTITAAMRGIGPDKPVIARFRVRTAAGGYHWVDGHGKPYIDAGGDTDGLIAALRIVDDQVEAQQRLVRLAKFDTLTGLPNRAEAIGRLESALIQPRSPGVHLGVLFCDVDHFKDINDTWGHAIGDVVLSAIAKRIREIVRHGDTVGRIGGDELVVLLPGIHGLGEAAQIAEVIRRCAAEPIHHAGHTIKATLSIGATISVPGESATAVTARADAAMYQAKSRDRNTVIPIEPPGNDHVGFTAIEADNAENRGSAVTGQVQEGSR